MQNLTPQQRLFLIGAGIVLTFTVLGLVLRGDSGGTTLEIVSAETESQENTFIARPKTTFKLNEEVDEDATITARVFPDTANTVLVEGDTVTFVPIVDLFDGTPYEVTLFHTPRQGDDRTSIGIHGFRTPEFTERREFLRSLPKDFGNYTIARIGELSVYVSVENGTAEGRRQEVLEFLAEKGITSDRYTIDIDGPDTVAPDQDLIVH